MQAYCLDIRINVCSIKRHFSLCLDRDHIARWTMAGSISAVGRGPNGRALRVVVTAALGWIHFWKWNDIIRHSCLNATHTGKVAIKSNDFASALRLW